MTVTTLAHHDWTDDIADGDHVRFFKSIDWAATPLGPLEQWSLPLRLFTHQALADSRPVVLYWGPRKVAVYNEAFVPLAGKAHPSLMGSPFECSFPEIWDAIKPVFNAAEATKKAVDVVEIPLMVERSGFSEETYFTGNFNPLRGESGAVAGFCNSLVEVTVQKLDERRRVTLNRIAAHFDTDTTKAMNAHVIDALSTNKLDIPMALMYEATDHDASHGRRLILRGNIGVPKGHQLSAQHVHLDSEDGIAPLLRKALSTSVTVPAGPEFEGIEWAGHDKPSRFISAMPIFNPPERFHGFLVIGANPCRPIDEHHHQLVRDLSRQLTATVAFVVNTENTVKMRRQLENDLAESERQIRYMAQHSSVGMEHVTTDGRVIWANDHFYTLIGRQAGSPLTATPLKNEVVAEDESKILATWAEVLKGEKALATEVRLKRQYQPPSGESVPATILLSSFPYLENGEVKSIMSCMTEVSQLKWAEAWQSRVAQEAVEARRLQSEFTDTISHEVRNPLSAIFQLADGISTSLETCRAQGLGLERCLQALADNVDAANTILVCANHQKRIVDDVLTLSKMDFELVALSPTAVQPSDLASGASQIFDANLSSNDIKLHIIPDLSLEVLGTDWVFCDPLRVTQVLINLVSNAIKFTKREKRRSISLTYGASLADPRQAFAGDTYWAPAKRAQRDVALENGWGSEDAVYLWFSVSDTGAGMTQEEVHRLFNRFEQASPNTSIKYGGSGLGLFISHKLSEKQGGSIGVSAELGKGSTFSFYVKSHRTTAPILSPSETSPSPRAHIERAMEEAKDMMAGLSIPKRKLSSAYNIVVKPDMIHVLLVEDNLVNQKIMQKQLTQAGCVVYVANHGAEALEFLQTTAYWKGKSMTGKRLDIVLLDWEMPVMDGLTCCKEIRSLERSGQLTHHVEVIAITANARQEQIDRALAAGMDSFMPKPFVIRDLMTKIRQRIAK